MVVDYLTNHARVNVFAGLLRKFRGSDPRAVGPRTISLNLSHVPEQPEVNGDSAVSIPCRLRRMSASWLARLDSKDS